MTFLSRHLLSVALNQTSSNVVRLIACLFHTTEHGGQQADYQNPHHSPRVITVLDNAVRIGAVPAGLLGSGGAEAARGRELKRVLSRARNGVAPRLAEEPRTGDEINSADSAEIQKTHAHGAVSFFSSRPETCLLESHQMPVSVDEKHLPGRQQRFTRAAINSLYISWLDNRSLSLKLHRSP
jgi:hypothetical protein